ncbi:hypothetical protein LUZ60_016805 [Juncus effusus]|nr:hypothetical protein LUZ60_016805 [Juncus effusus]
MSNTLLKVQPSELKMPFELHKQNSCYMQLTNKTDQHVAFKVKTTNPKKYSVRPNTGVVQPGGSCNVTVTMLGPKEIPPDYHCKDKFLVQSVVADEGTTAKDIGSDMFNKSEGKTIEESKLRVVYIPANPPSPVPEEAEDEDHNASSEEDNINNINNNGSSIFHPSSSASNAHDETSGQEAKSVINKLTEEKRRANEQNQQLKQQLELLKKEKTKGRLGLSVTTMVIVFILAIIVGYLVKKS